MERLLQWLDDFEDFVYLVILSVESIRRIARSMFFALLVVALQAAGIFFALENPALTVAGGSLLLVAILYRGAVYRDIGKDASRRQSVTA